MTSSFTSYEERIVEYLIDLEMVNLRDLIFILLFSLRLSVDSLTILKILIVVGIA